MSVNKSRKPDPPPKKAPPKALKPHYGEIGKLLKKIEKNICKWIDENDQVGTVKPYEEWLTKSTDKNAKKRLEKELAPLVEKYTKKKTAFLKLNIKKDVATAEKVKLHEAQHAALSDMVIVQAKLAMLDTLKALKQKTEPKTLSTAKYWLVDIWNLLKSYKNAKLHAVFESRLGTMTHMRLYQEYFRVVREMLVMQKEDYNLSMLQFCMICQNFILPAGSFIHDAVGKALVLKAQELFSQVRTTLVEHNTKFVAEVAALTDDMKILLGKKPKAMTEALGAFPKLVNDAKHEILSVMGKNVLPSFSLGNSDTCFFFSEYVSVSGAKGDLGKIRYPGSLLHRMIVDVSTKEYSRENPFFIAAVIEFEKLVLAGEYKAAKPKARQILKSFVDVQKGAPRLTIIRDVDEIDSTKDLPLASESAEVNLSNSVKKKLVEEGNKMDWSTTAKNAPPPAPPKKNVPPPPPKSVKKKVDEAKSDKVD